MFDMDAAGRAVDVRDPQPFAGASLGMKAGREEAAGGVEAVEKRG